VTLAQDAAGHAAQDMLPVQLLVLLTTAAIVALVFRRLKLELIPGYLIAGAIVGPHALGFVGDGDAVEEISHLAVILLMFGIGLHLDLRALRRGLVHILAVGIASTAIVVFVLWGAMAILPDLPAPVALVLALAGAMSSTAVLVRVVAARREGRTTHGRVTIGVAIVQDLAAVVFMAVLPPIAGWAGNQFTGLPGEAAPPPGAPAWVQFVTAAGIGLGGITVMVLAGRVVLPRVLDLAARTGSTELVLVVSAAVALGTAVGTSALGFSPEMGALLAGFLLAGTPFRYQLSGQFAPMRDLLMAVFFTAVGMNVSPAIIGQYWHFILGGAAAVIVLKTAVIAGCGWIGGMTPRSALLTGVYLGNAGEFSIVVLASAALQGVLAPQVQAAAIASVIISLVISPLLIEPANRLADRLTGKHALFRTPLRDAAGKGAPAGELSGHIILAGFGVVGRALADRFAVLGLEFAVIELNPSTVHKQTVLGRKVVYGDVTNPDVLEEAGVGRAAAVILTIPDEAAALKACREIRDHSPDIFIAVRTSYLSGKFLAHQLGADVVTVEEVATAQAMEREVLAKLTKMMPTPGSHPSARVSPAPTL